MCILFEYIWLYNLFPSTCNISGFTQVKSLNLSKTRTLSTWSRGSPCRAEILFVIQFRCHINNVSYAHCRFRNTIAPGWATDNLCRNELLLTGISNLNTRKVRIRSMKYVYICITLSFDGNVYSTGCF